MQQRLFYILFFISGIAGLGYELLWTRMFTVVLGHEIVSVLAVISAFFSGLALGAWFLDRPISRSSSPGRWYSFLELFIGIWALALIVLIPKLNPQVASFIGVEPSPLRHWAVSFIYPFLLLLPATAAMGGTLPAMDRFCAQKFGRQRSVGGLYSANTFGAMAGTLLTTFLFMPLFGLAKASFILAGANFFGAMVAMALDPGKEQSEEGSDSRSSPQSWPVRISVILFATGLLGIGFEVLMVRALSQIIENTVYSFASVLMIFLFGTAAGAGIYQRSRFLDFEKSLTFLLVSISFFCLGAVFMLRYLDPLFSMLQGILGGGFVASIVAELGIALLYFFLPTAAMGATFSHLAQSMRGAYGGVGRALCLNTLGSAAAPLVWVVWLLPAMGLKFALLLVASGYVLLVPRSRPSKLLPITLPLAVGLFIALHPYPYQFVSLSEGEQVESYNQGIMASVSVVSDKHDDLHLKVNNHFQMGGTTSVFSDRRQALLPLLLHPDPWRALFLGLGTGATFATAGDYPGLEAEGVELIPEVIEAIPSFAKVTGDLGAFENLHVIAADARRYVSSTDKKYDVVIADLFHPARDGAGSLYTVEHFAAIRNRLTEEGLFCQWLPLYQLDLEMFKVIAGSFLQVFPEGQAYLGHYSLDYPIIALIGGSKPFRFHENWYENRLHSRGMRQMAAAFGYDSVYSILGTFLAGSEDLRQFVKDTPVNTDNFPVVLFKAPYFVYGNPEPPGTKLLTLVKTFSPPNPDAILAKEITEGDFMARERLAAYWSARNSFLEFGVDVERTRDAQKLYAAVSEPLLKVIRQSADFSAAYFPLLSIAYDIYPFDTNASRELLLKLEQANPLRQEASLLRKKLFLD